MNFVTVEGRTLKQALRPLLPIADQKTTIPVLSHLKLTVAGPTLTIEANDLDIDIVATVDPIDCHGEWSVCLPARVLGQIAHVAGVMPVQIEPPKEDMANARIALGDGDAEYEVPTLPVSDFPEFNQEQPDLIETFTNGMLATLLDKVSWCVSSEETRYYLSGVFWQFGAERCMVATDGHRLARCRYSGDASQSPNVIIPKATVEILSRHLAGKDVRVFGRDGKYLAFHADGIVIRSKTIDGTFPDYTRVIPKDQTFSFEMKRIELIDAVTRAQAVGGERGRAVRFYDRDGRIAIERKSPDFGAAKVRTSTEWPKAGNRWADSFGFNGFYILDIVKRCEGDVTFGMDDQGSPFTITDADETMTRVIMPMRV